MARSEGPAARNVQPGSVEASPRTVFAGISATLIVAVAAALRFRLDQVWWFFPFLVCLVLTGIHGYLGIHVLKRKVIFVDLAMAQIAALGAAYAVLLDYDPKEDAAVVHLFSLGFTLAGAAVIAATRMRRERVPHEAIIGIVYASASALALLVLSKAKGEGEQIKHMLVGNLLFVKPSKVWITAAIYAVIGLFHWVYRKRFFAISENPEEAESAGVRVRFWDFLFYVTFGVVITSSVSIAGVLLVFSFLVVPGVIAVLFAEGTRARILIAWAVGTGVSILGLAVSNHWDLVPGPSVVAAFAAVLLAAGLVHHVVSSERSGVAAGRLAAIGGIAVLAIWGTSFLRKPDRGHDHREDEFSRMVEALNSEDPTVVIDAIHHMEHLKDHHAVGDLVRVLRTTKNDRIIEHAGHALARLEAVEAVPALREVAARDLDPELRLEVARSLLDLRDPGGFPVLLDLLEKDAPAQVRRDALALFQERSGRPGDPAALRKWWNEKGSGLRWRGQTRRFE